MSDGRNWLKSKIALKVSWGAAGDVLSSIPQYDENGEPVINGDGEVQMETINVAGSDIISLPNTFTSTTTQNFDRIHGFGYSEFNAGAVRKIPTYTFTLTLPAVSNSVRLFRALMTARRPFKLEVIDAASIDAGVIINGDSFRLIWEAFDACYITDMDTGYEIADVPTITFNGIALRYDFMFLDEAGARERMGTDFFHVFGDKLLSTDAEQGLFTDVWDG